MNEFDICWLKNRDYAEVTAPTGTALKSKIMKWAATKVKGVVITAQNPDGSIVAHVPISFVKVARHRKKVLTEEEKARLANNLAEYRARKAAEQAETEDDVEDLDLFDTEEDEEEE